MSNVVDGRDILDAIDKVATNSMLGARADFKPDLFDTAIRQKGYRMVWEQGMFCSCLTLDSGQPDYSCTTCKGKGYIYFDPKEIRALVTSINGHKNQERPGLDDMGSAYLTPTSEHNVGFRDRFTFVDFTTKFSEVLTRSYELTNVLRYPAKDIIAVRSLNTEYRRGIDFDLSKDGTTITWKETPPQRFSILYNTCPVYIAIGPIHDIRGTYTMAKAGGAEAFIELPKQFQIKREDFLDNEA